MKKKSHKLLLAGALFGFGAILLSSCTASFCSTMDQAAMAYPYDQGVTVYLSKTEFEALQADPESESAIVIAQELAWSQEATALGLPAIAGPAFGNADDQVYKYIPFAPKVTSNTDAEGNVTTEYTRAADGSLIVDAYTAKKYSGSVLSTALSSSASNGYYTPSIYYFGLIDDLTLKAAIIESDAGTQGFGYGSYRSVETWDEYIATASGEAYVKSLVATSTVDATVPCVNPYDQADTTGNGANQIDAAYSVLRQNGHIKFSGVLTTDNKGVEVRSLFENLNNWNAYIRDEYSNLGFSLLDSYALPTKDFTSVYQSSVNSKINAIRSCIATRPGYYGHYGPNADWRVPMQEKSWGYAWSKGFLEGLLVYPVSWLTDTFAIGLDPSLSGFGQIWAIVFVTLIVRLLLALVSLPSTIDSQKMQALQPELAKIQAKYPNSNTNQAQKQRVAQEQANLYKRHGIKPFRQILMLIIQFPVFICVWSGLQGSSALATGEFLNVSLSDTIQQTLFNVSGTWYLNTHGWWTALVLFILMSGVQVMAMLTPRIIQKIQTKNMAKMGRNSAQEQQNKTMKWMTIIMTGMTIFMGFMLPSAMGVYWLIGGLIQIIQTVVVQLVLAKKKRK